MREVLKRLGVVALVLGLAGAAHAETCIQLDRVNSGDDNVDLLIAPVALTVDAIACHCDGLCTSPVATLALTDRAGNAISLAAALTCSTGVSNSVWTSTNALDTDRDLILGEGLEVSVTNTPVSFDLYTICVRFT